MRLGGPRSHSDNIWVSLKTPSKSAIALHEKSGRDQRYPGCYDAGVAKPGLVFRNPLRALEQRDCTYQQNDA
jgi:hypothetical protein